MKNRTSQASRTYIFLSFLLIMVLIAAEIGGDLYHASVYNKQLQFIIDTQTKRGRLVYELRSIVRERVLTLNNMLLADDPFAVEDGYERFLQWGNRFIEKRQQLASSLETEKEKALFEKLRQTTMEGTPVIERAVALAREGDLIASRKLLIEVVQPIQDRVVRAADHLLNHYLELVNRQAEISRQQNERGRRERLLFGLVILILVLGIGSYVTRRIERDSRALQQAKQGLEEAVAERTRELKRTTELLETAQQVAGIGHWEWHIPSGGLKWSDQIYRIFGVEPGAYEPSYDAFLAAVHPDDRELVVQGVNAAVSGERKYSVEHRVVWPDGTHRVVHERGIVDYNDDGSPLRMVGTVHDITERKRTERELQLAASVYHSTGDGIIITDQDNTIIEVNEAFSEILGYSREELVGQNPRVLRSGKHDKAFFQRFWDSLERTGQWQGEVWDRHKSGEVIPLWLTVNVVRDDSGALSNYVALFRDITQSKENEQRLWHIAHHDALTGLPNRSLMYGRLQLAMEQADRDKSAMALMLIDLDGFKQVNDSLGHGAGDEVLVRVASRLREQVRESDTVVRYAGDEFVVVLKGLYQRETINHIANAMIDEIARPMEIEGQVVQIGASIGIALYPTNAYDGDSLIARADEAMYRAKKAGKGGCRFYDGKQ